MQRLFRQIFILFFFFIRPSDAMQITEFKHGMDSAFQSVKDEYTLLLQREDLLLEHFKFCCKNKDSLSSKVNNALGEIVMNAAGKETLRTITAKLYPFVYCASTLESLGSAISTNKEGDRKNMRDKAKKIVLLFSALGVQSTPPREAIGNVCTYLDRLKGDPIIFPKPDTSYTKGALLRVFGGSGTGDDMEKRAIMADLNKLWGGAARNAVLAFSKRLKRGMFSILESQKTRYESDKSDKYAIHFSGADINAPCITGPLCKSMATSVMPSFDTYYSLQNQDISSSSGLHHELFHHLAIGLELAEYPSFDKLMKVLQLNNVDESYIILLEKIYTDMDEFRNIIGIFVDDSGHVFFDPCSEAAYLTKSGSFVRATHKTGMVMRRIHIKFVNFIKEANKTIKIQAGDNVNRDDRFDWM